MSVDAQQVLGHYGLDGAAIEPYGAGLINETYRVTAADGARFILQAMNPVFDPAINIDIDVVTRHIDALGATTPRLVPPVDQGEQLWVNRDGRNWRLSTFVPGVCHDRLQSPEQARHAGALLGSFHRMVCPLDIKLHGARTVVHDTPRHLAGLRSALVEHTDHRYFSQAAPLAEQILQAAEQLPQLPDLPERLMHGDPKISNLVFDEQTGAGVCMIDFDTLAHMPLPLEMGDAIRSWCNPKGEDERQAQFRIDLFTAAIEGYAAEAGSLLDPAEWQAFVPAASTIMVELAARFTRDALREVYFGWNADKFPDRSTHNLVRAEGQLNLHRSFCAQLDAAEVIVDKAFRA
ncbi:MAG: phosphotransferase [Gammaproteobacteria bacterium]|nr:phosphotransferase [Gammaproteobacteria bacterium]